MTQCAPRFGTCLSLKLSPRQRAHPRTSTRTARLRQTHLATLCLPARPPRCTCTHSWCLQDKRWLFMDGAMETLLGKIQEAGHPLPPRKLHLHGHRAPSLGRHINGPRENTVIGFLGHHKALGENSGCTAGVKIKIQERSSVSRGKGAAFLPELPTGSLQPTYCSGCSRGALPSLLDRRLLMLPALQGLQGQVWCP